MSNSSLLDEAFRCVDAIGYDKTIHALHRALGRPTPKPTKNSTPTNKNDSRLIDEIFQAVDVLKYDRTVEVLREAQFKEITFTDSRMECVVLKISSRMGIPVHEIYIWIW